MKYAFLALFAIVLAFVTSGANQVAVSPASIAFPLADTTEASFERTCNGEDGRDYTVSRVSVEPMDYDGDPGYSAIMIRSRWQTRVAVRNEMLTAFPAGQYRLFWFEPMNARVYAYELIQDGICRTIRGIRVFDPDNLDGKPVGPDGFYQYGARSLFGTHCVLFDSTATVVNLKTGEWHRTHLDQSLPSNAAEPRDNLKFDCFSLTGEFLNMKGSAGDQGTLTLRDIDGDTVWTQEIDIRGGQKK